MPELNFRGSARLRAGQRGELEESSGKGSVGTRWPARSGEGGKQGHSGDPQELCPVETREPKKDLSRTQ